MDWDVFISHAWEDKEAFARPLARALEAKGLRVWFDKFTLRVGDSLRRSIDRGLAQSRYGVVILSPNFFAKEWPQKELDGLAAREMSGEKVILPVWHNITAEQIREYSPTLADRVAVLSERGLEHVVKELLRVIKPAPEMSQLHKLWPELNDEAKESVLEVMKLVSGPSESSDEADLDRDAIDILKKIAEENGGTSKSLSSIFTMPEQKIQFYLDTLRARKFLGRPFLSSQGAKYFITKKGREYLVKKGLI